MAEKTAKSPLCEGTSYRRDDVRVFDASATENRPIVFLVCKRCSHVLAFEGGSNLYDIT